MDRQDLPADRGDEVVMAPVPTFSHMLPLAWWRGTTTRRGDDLIRVEHADYERYVATENPAGAMGYGSPTADLARVGAAAPSDRPRMALQYVRRHGLLTRRPPGGEPAGSASSEQVDEIVAVGQRVFRILDSAAVLRSMPGPRPTRAERQRLAPLFDAQGVDLDGRLPMQAIGNLALGLEISTGLVNTSVRAVGFPVNGAAYGVGLALQPMDLHALVFARLALLSAETGPLLRCEDPECGRWFIRQHGSQRFCRPGCADRKRDRAIKARQRRQRKEAMA